VFTNDDIARMPPLTTAVSSHQSPAPPPGPQEGLAGAAKQSGQSGVSIPSGSSAAQPGQAESGMKSKEYWQARFEAVRAALAHAKEEQKLVEDELRLLQVQQARTLDPDLSRKLNSQIDSRASELEAKRAATEKAQAALDKTEKEFKESGAPQDWIQSEKGPD
jgi:hypothetical protein